jgi:hypothetical protein
MLEIMAVSRLSSRESCMEDVAAMEADNIRKGRIVYVGSQLQYASGTQRLTQQPIKQQSVIRRDVQ